MPQTPPLLRWIAAWLLGVSPLPAAPLITEFLASNATGIKDEDGDRPDWIEIYNPDASPLDLGGYHLTDNPENPRRWTVPFGVLIPAGRYLVIFASDKDRKSLTSPLHTNFKLSADGEYVGLFAPGGSGPALSEFVERLGQSKDISYGLTRPEPDSSPGYFTTPTPGTANTVRFSLRSRTFSQGSPQRAGPLAVALSFDSPGATIRYTTNQSVPIAATGIAADFAVTAGTNVLTTPVPHGLAERDEVRVATTSALPGGLIAGVNYYVYKPTANTFQLLTADALRFVDGPPPGLAVPVELTSSGAGTQSVYCHAAYFSVNISNDSLAVSNGPFFDGDEVEVVTTDSAPGGLVATTLDSPAVSPYYVRIVSGLFKLSSAPGGGPLDITSEGMGRQTLRRRPSPAYISPIPITSSQRIRARAFEPGRQDSPTGSETYLMLDAAAQAFTSNLPIVITETWGSVVPTTKVAVPAHIMIFEPKEPDQLARLTNPPDVSAPCSLERRGAATLGDPKYSMNLETWDESNNDREFPILGMPSDSDWVMRAPYNFDRSMMRDDLIYRLSNDLGRYAVRTKFVEVFHNTTINSPLIQGANFATASYGDYFGVYSFTEKITRDDNRVNVEKLRITDNTAPQVYGGYIFKVDRLDAGNSGISPLTGQSFGGVGSMVWVYPKERSLDPGQVVTAAQSNYFRDFVGDAAASLRPDVFMNPATGYANFFDVPSVIDHQILNIGAKNPDANRLSGYWHKPRFGKLTAGPLWDFDRSQGSTDGRDLNPVTWRGDNGDLGTDFFHYPWYNEMFKDPNFWQAFIDRFEELRQGPLSTAKVHAAIDAYAVQLNFGDGGTTTVYDSPAKRNGRRWVGFRGASANTPGTNGTYPGEVQWLKNWWQSRLNFMDGQFTRPAVASLPSGPVAPGSQVTLTSPSLSTPGVRILYTTNGTDPRPAATAPEPWAVAAPTIATLLPEISNVRAIVPTSATTGGPSGTEWHGADINPNGNNADDFDDAGWFTNGGDSINGVGYDDGLAISFLPYISIRWNTMDPNNTLTGRTAVAPQDATNTMRQCAAVAPNPALNGNQSCYIRCVFDLSAADMVNLVPPNKFVLQLRFDDGFVSWLNGTELTSARHNAPATASLTFSSAATSTHDDIASTSYVDYDITAFVSSLHAGTNVLAIQGLNSIVTSTDFLIQPKLVVQAPPPPYTPAVSPGAVEYTGAIMIDAPTQLFVRTLHPNLPSDPPTRGGGGTGSVPNGSSWSAPTRLYYFPGAVAASLASIQISELLYHPNPPAANEMANGWTNSNDFEFLRITNTGPVPVDLTGIFFSNGLDFTAVPGLQNWLPAGQSVVIVENMAAFTFRYGNAFTILGEFKGELDDKGEHIVLHDKTGAVIADFRYDDTSPWPASADDGYSLIYSAGNPNLPGNWSASADPGGSVITASATTYDRWLRIYYPVSELPSQPMNRDDDGDGLNNFGEYIFATNPRVPGSGEHAMGKAAAGKLPGLMVRRRSAVTDVTWTFETSTALTAWTASGSPPESIVKYPDGTEMVTWRASAPPGTKLYMRVRAMSP